MRVLLACWAHSVAGAMAGMRGGGHAGEVFQNALVNANGFNKSALLHVHMSQVGDDVVGRRGDF